MRTVSSANSRPSCASKAARAATAMPKAVGQRCISAPIQRPQACGASSVWSWTPAKVFFSVMVPAQILGRGSSAHAAGLPRGGEDTSWPQFEPGSDHKEGPEGEASEREGVVEGDQVR